MNSRGELIQFLSSGDEENLRALFINALFTIPPQIVVGAGVETFASELIAAYDELSSVAARLLVQDTCTVLLKVAPWRHARLHQRGLVELLAIARHTSSLSSARCMFELVQREIRDEGFRDAWTMVGDLIVSTIIEPIHVADVQDYARKLFFDPRFEDCAFIAFFRLAEIGPASCVDLIPRFIELYSKLKAQQADSLFYLRRRFADVFDLDHTAYLLRTLRPLVAMDLASEVIPDIYRVESQARETFTSAVERDEPIPIYDYYIATQQRKVEVNAAPFVRGRIRRARRESFRNLIDIREQRTAGAATGRRAKTVH